MPTSTPFDIRPARREHVGALLAMIRALAHYEQLSHLCIAAEADIDAALFGRNPVAEVLIAQKGDEAAGFALFFHNFSTFVGRKGLWLEDLFVQPAYRGQGCGKALLQALAAIAVERNCGRFEWAVLDWNAKAIGFYQALGAAVLPDWRIVRVAGAALSTLASYGGSDTDGTIYNDDG